LIYGPIDEDGIWRTRYNNELYMFYDELHIVLKIRRLRSLAHLFRMQELDPCRKLTLYKPEGTPHFRNPRLRWLELVEEDLKNMGIRNGDASHRIEKSRGQFWKRLRSTKDCNARRRRRSTTINYYQLLLMVSLFNINSQSSHKCM
jgi:hypothetical protein